MLGGNLDGGQDVIAGGGDDDANGIDLVVRGVGAVEHAGDGVKADLARDAALQVVLERRGGKRECAVRPEPVAIANGCRSRWTDRKPWRSSRYRPLQDRWGEEAPRNQAKA